MELKDVKELQAMGFTPEQITNLSNNWKLESNKGEPTPPAQGEPTPPAQGEPTPPAQGEPTPPAQGEPTPPAQGEPTPPANQDQGSKLIEALQAEIKGLKETLQASNIQNAKQPETKVLSTDEILAEAMNPYIDKRKEK